VPTLPQRKSTILRLIRIACLFAATPVFAAEITVYDGKPSAVIIGGRILGGDEKVFHKVAATLPNPLILLISPGGSVAAALEIGLEIRARGLKTVVPDGAFCASACAFIWLAGTTRMLGTDAHIGFHAISAPRGGRVFNETHEFDPVLMHYLLELGYTGDATAMIVNTPSMSIRWLDRIELNSNGFAAESFP